jgi:hypothetical protein
MPDRKIDIDKLKQALNVLDHDNDDHWNKEGKPDLNHLKEAGFGDLERSEPDPSDPEPPADEAPADDGVPDESPPDYGDGEPDERGPDDPNAVEKQSPEVAAAEVAGEPDPAEEGLPEEPGIEDDKRAGAVDPETGEPRLTPEQFGAILQKPYAYSTGDVGAAIIKGLDHLALAMTAEVRTRQQELFQVFQLYAAERPSILERQKRLQLRQNQG